MEIAFLEFGSEVFWKLALTDPSTYKIQAYPGVELVSPLLYPSFDARLNSPNISSRREIFGCLGNLCIARSRGVAFKVEEGHLADYLPNVGGRRSQHLVEAIPLVGVASNLLYALRHFSKQAGVRAEGDAIIACSSFKIDALPSCPALEEFKARASINKALFDSAITLAHIELACASDVGFRAPVFDTLFLDAINAHAAHDYRKSILYSAMALETAAATILDDYYENKVRWSGDAAWRPITLSQAGGEAVRK